MLVCRSSFVWLVFFFPIIFPTRFRNAPCFWAVKSRRAGLSAHGQPHHRCDHRSRSTCHVAAWADRRGSHRPSWRSHLLCAVLHLFALSTRPRNGFPKGSAFVLAAVHILLPCRPPGLRLPLCLPLLLLVPPLPPHVLCFKYSSTRNDPVKKTQVICLRSTLRTRRHSRKQLKGDVEAS